MPHPGSVADQHGRPLDQVRLTGIRAKGYHGVLDHERAEGQVFVADVVVHLDTRRAAAGDDLSLTLSYATLAEQVVEVIEGPAVQLVETLAEQIASVVMDHAVVGAVDVFVHKPHAPVPVPFDDVVVAVHRDRTKLPAARFDPQALPAASVASLPSLHDDGEAVAEPAFEHAPAPIEAPLGADAMLFASDNLADGTAADDAAVELGSGDVPVEEPPLGAPSLEAAPLEGVPSADGDAAATTDAAVREDAPGGGLGALGAGALGAAAGLGDAPLPGGGTFASGGALPGTGGASLRGGMTFPPSTDDLGEPVLPSDASRTAVPAADEPAPARRFDVAPLDATIEMPVPALDDEPYAVEEPAPVVSPDEASSDAAGPADVSVFADEASSGDATARPDAFAPAESAAPADAFVPVDAFAPIDREGPIDSEALVGSAAPVDSAATVDAVAPVESTAPVEGLVTLGDVPRRTSAFAPLRETAAAAVETAPATESTPSATEAMPLVEDRPSAEAEPVADAVVDPQSGAEEQAEAAPEPPAVEDGPDLIPFPEDEPVALLGALETWHVPDVEPTAEAADEAAPVAQDAPASDVLPPAEIPGHPFSPVTAPDVEAAPVVAPPVTAVPGHPFAPVSSQGAEPVRERAGLADIADTPHPFTPVTAPELAGAVTDVPLVAEVSAHPFAPVTAPDAAAVPDVEPEVEAAPAVAAEQPDQPRERDRMDEVPSEPVRAILALGANLGDPRATLRQAVRELESSGVIDIEAVAPLARTAAVGGPEQPDFLNTVIMVRTFLAPRELLHLCQHIEQVHGRVRTEHWGPRTLDIDIITYGQVTGVTDDLELPHPRAHERAFVLQPWDQIEPGAVLPGLGGGPVDALAATAPDLQGVRWLALDWLDEEPGEGSVEDVPPTRVQPSAPTPLAEGGPGQ
nr:2-amino-4-hydroxy-6-hydroxymethyldihydropteridine diphosphokinase [Sanguibacter hominis]